MGVSDDRGTFFGGGSLYLRGDSIAQVLRRTFAASTAAEFLRPELLGQDGSGLPVLGQRQWQEINYSTLLVTGLVVCARNKGITRQTYSYPTHNPTSTYPTPKLGP